MYCEGELILLFKIEFCGLLYLVIAIHRFDSTLVVKRTQEIIPLEGDKDLSSLKYLYVFYARSSTRRTPTHAVKAKDSVPSNAQYLQFYLLLA